MKTEYQRPVSLRQILVGEFARRCDKNPRYSLRAFAAQLGVDPGNLSRALRGQTELSKIYRDRIADALAISPRARCELDVKAQKTRVQDDNEVVLEESIFSAISDPIHYQILELSAVEGFQSNAKWIARRLAVPVPKVVDAIERLLRLGLLKVMDDGHWRKMKPKLKSMGGTSVALREHQKRIAESSIAALEVVPLKERCHMSMTMPSDPEKIELARKRIESFVARLTDELSDGSRKEVFQLQVSLFPVSRRIDDE